jgi:hypothetical protein
VQRLIVIAALLAITSAHALRTPAYEMRAKSVSEEPYAPSPAAAPLVSLGYRELLADLLFFRLIGYYGGKHETAPGVAAMVEAIVAADPGYEKVYVWGARAISVAMHGGSNDTVLRAIRILEAGTERFPTNYRIPELAGELYLVELKTDDPAQRRAWDEKAARLLEIATRRPGAPADRAELVAELRSRTGQRQRAIDGLREMILIANDERARAGLLEKLAELEQSDSAEIAAEMFEARHGFTNRWRAERPAVPATMYILLGPPERPGFDLGDLATGGRDLITADVFERLPPLTDN